MVERVSVFGAHCDDESFGMLGQLLKHKDAGDTIEFYAFSSARNTLNGYTKMAEYFKSNWEYVGLNDQCLYSYSFVENVIKPIEDTMALFKPTVVYCPFIGDLNRDHRTVAEAVMVSCRPSRFSGQVWMYSIKGTTELGFRDFKADKKVKIDQPTKLRLLKAWYPNEMINGREVIDDTEVFEKWPR